MKDALLEEIARHGARGAIVSIARFNDLRREMEGLAAEVHHGWSDWRADTMKLPDNLDFKPQSLISVVTPSPIVMVRFNHSGKPFDCLIPPHYCYNVRKDLEILHYINTFLSRYGHAAAVATDLPQKLLAVNSGLCQYGRNNICFNKEFGSFMHIMSYVSDIPCDDDTWVSSSRMAACENCLACVHACPTNAIESSRRIIDGFKCLTFLNEFPGDFPDWLDSKAHHCLIGCLRCQISCPQNAHNKDNIVKSVAFTEEETAELLKGEPYSAALNDKIDEAGIEQIFTNVLARNLTVLLRHHFSNI